MKTTALTLSIFMLTSLFSGGFAMAQDTLETPECTQTFVAKDVASGTFQKKRYSIHGSWSINSDCTSQSLTFSEDFKTKNGPDLKLFLSPKPLAELNGKNAQEGALKLSVLKSSSGAQTYDIPLDINLADYKSVLVQCEAFSVLWGGFDLNSSDD